MAAWAVVVASVRSATTAPAVSRFIAQSSRSAERSRVRKPWSGIETGAVRAGYDRSKGRRCHGRCARLTPGMMRAFRVFGTVLGLALLGAIATPGEEPAGAAGLKAVASGRVVRIVRSASGKSVLEEPVRADVLDVAQSAHEPYLF